MVSSEWGSLLKLMGSHVKLRLGLQEIEDGE